MNLESEDRERVEIARLKHHSKLLYVRGGGSNDFCVDSTPDQRENGQSTDTFEKKCIIPLRGHNRLSEPGYSLSRASSESICSRYTHMDTKYPPDVSGVSKIQTKSGQSEYNNNQKYDIHVKATFIDGSNQVSEELYGRNHENYSDKTTYCRPVLNLYNQEFLFKTMEKNAKLRKLVTELAIARQKEKEIGNWNNYINELRKKHSRNTRVNYTTSLQNVSNERGTSDTIEDIYNTKFTCRQSDPCQDLLQNFYRPHDIRTNYYDYDSTSNNNIRTSRGDSPFQTNPLCFPTSSQGRLTILERERRQRLANRGYKPLFRTINEEKRLEHDGSKTTNRKGVGPRKCYVVRNSQSTNTTLRCTSTQTEDQMMCSKSVGVIISKACNTSYVIYDKGPTKEMQSEGTTPEKKCNINNNLRKNSLVCIEEKLDNLIHSINNFIIEIKRKSGQQKYFDQYTKLGKTNINHTKSDGCGIARNEKNVCGFFDDSSRTTRNSSIDDTDRIQTIDENLTKMNNILLKEIGKNKLLSLKGSSVGETNYPWSGQISVTIPTKEISTEVTRSLSKAGSLANQNIEIEEIPSGEDRRTATAVNTDPLSLLAMLKVSTEETIRRLISYVPTIDYYNYLSRLQGPPPQIVESHYVCNICGAAFRKPSALTDHIEKHELGNTRDCCVCRHVLDFPRRRPGLFKCQYCGQCFTRAYCCELHQEACARRLGKLHDVKSSLVLLR